MKELLLGRSWRRFTIAAFLYALFSIVPAMLVLSCVFDLEISILSGVFIGQAIAFLILRKTFYSSAESILTAAYALHKSSPDETETNEDQMVLGVSLCKENLYSLSFLMAWFSAAIIVLLGALLPWEIELRFTFEDLLILSGCIALSYVLHEALHGLAAMMWGKIPIQSLHFGFNRRFVALYCHADRPMPVSAYRMFAILPMIVITPVAGLILWWDPATWSVLLFSVVFCGCAGDVLVFFRLRGVESDKWIQDHPSEVGLYVLSSTEAPTIRIDEPHEPMRYDPGSSSST